VAGSDSNGFKDGSLAASCFNWPHGVYLARNDLISSLTIGIIEFERFHHKVSPLLSLLLSALLVL